MDNESEGMTTRPGDVRADGPPISVETPNLAEAAPSMAADEVLPVQPDVDAHQFCEDCGSALGGNPFCAECGSPIGGVQRSQHDAASDQPTNRPFSRKLLALVSLTAVLLLCGVIGGWVVIRNVTASEHAISGELVLIDIETYYELDDGDSCSGTGGYSDIDSGTSVKVRNEDGTLIGSGALESGTVKNGGTCVFPYSISSIADANFYVVEISGRGELSYSAAEMRARDWTLATTLGDLPD